MLPRTSCPIDLIIGTLLAVSTIVITQSNPISTYRSIQSAVAAVESEFEIRDFGRPLVLFNGEAETGDLAASLCESHRQ
jgi:hypothetical protein